MQMHSVKKNIEKAWKNENKIPDFSFQLLTTINANEI